MKQYTKSKIIIGLGILITIFIIGLSSTFLFFGYKNKNTFLVWLGIYVLLFFILNVISVFVNERMADKKREPILSKINNNLSNHDKEMLEKYTAISDDEYNDVGFVHFASEQLKFSATAKYGWAKDFNDTEGIHLAFNIKGTELVSKPEDYEDVVFYEETLFDIELGYFDGFLLSTPENDNGILVDSLDNLEGKTIKISQNDGYIATIFTAETDEIEVGEIKFVKWQEDEKIIKIKLAVCCGLADIVVGTVALEEDSEQMEKLEKKLNNEDE